MASLTMSIVRPEPPVVGKVTHFSIELIWNHVKEKLEPNKRYKYTLQEIDKSRSEWTTVYSGFGIVKVIEDLEPLTEYSYRISYKSPDSKNSEYSQACIVKTLSEPITGEVLHKAILLDRRTEVEKLLETPEGKHVLEIPDKFGNLPLMIAVTRNNLEMVESLISFGADVNAQNDSGKTALMLAAFSGKQKIVKLLRECGAVYNLCDKSGSFALHYAVDGGNLDTLQWMLLDGADANARDTTSGWTPLLRAASTNANKDCAELLIKFGADVNIRDTENKNALTISVINGNLPFVELLVEKGADLHFKNEYGKTVYDLAVSMDRRRVIRYLDQYFSMRGLGGSLNKKL